MSIKSQSAKWLAAGSILFTAFSCQSNSDMPACKKKESAPCKTMKKCDQGQASSRCEKKSCETKVSATEEQSATQEAVVEQKAPVAAPPVAAEQTPAPAQPVATEKASEPAQPVTVEKTAEASEKSAPVSAVEETPAKAPVQETVVILSEESSEVVSVTESSAEKK
jgi:hypothetical protein